MPRIAHPRVATSLGGIVLLCLLAVPVQVIRDTLALADRSELMDRERWLYAELRNEADRLLHNHEIARDHHRVYAVDLAQLAIYAALAEDRAMYDPLRALMLEHLVIDTPVDDPYAHGMVAWGYTADPDDATRRVEPLDASGTTEALRVAEALILGVDAFGHDDEPVVRDILHAYARHQTIEGDTWYVRNYFNLGTRGFATNCFLIDLDPDLVARLAERFDDDGLRELADRKAALIERCRVAAPAGHGLLHQMIRPEIATAMGDRYVVYSANGHEQTNLTLTVAERCVTTNPDAARAALDFALDRLPRLYLHYDTATGRPARGFWATAHGGPETLAPLLRLAVHLDDPDAVEAILPELLRVADELLESDYTVKLYATGETLWALELARQYLDRPPSR